MDQKELSKFDKELEADPSGPPISHGTRDLLSFMASPLVKTGEGRRP